MAQCVAHLMAQINMILKKLKHKLENLKILIIKCLGEVGTGPRAGAALLEGLRGDGKSRTPDRAFLDSSRGERM